MGYRKMAAVSLLCVTIALAAAAQEALPEGEGKTTVEAACASRCHAASTVMRAKRTSAEWEQVLEVMIERGAKVADDEYDIILTYLSQQLPATVNVNTATGGRIAEVLDISEEQASAIVERREKQGPFKNWEEVAKVPGLDAKLIEERKARLIF